ncbi:hypothetical protein BH20ACT9_BH20ACT9_07570 [soil metagenome]
MRATEDPGLRVQFGALSVEGDADVRAGIDERVERLGLRGPHVCRRDDAESAATAGESSELLEHGVHAAELHEGADQIDGVGACQLGLQLRADRRPLAVVHQQLVGRQRHLRPGREPGVRQSVGFRDDAEENFGRLEQPEALGVVHHEEPDQLVDRRGVGGRGGAMPRERLAEQARRVAAQQFEAFSRFDYPPLDATVGQRGERALEAFGDQFFAKAEGQQPVGCWRRVGHRIGARGQLTRTVSWLSLSPASGADELTRPDRRGLEDFDRSLDFCRRQAGGSCGEDSSQVFAADPRDPFARD